MGKYSKSTYLFSRPSFFEGMARVLDLAGSLQVYNLSKTPVKADQRALWSDWKAIGEDISSAMGTFGNSKINSK